MDHNDALLRYRAALAACPPTGTGQRQVHRWTLTTANLAVRAGVSRCEWEMDVHGHATRPVTREELSAAWRKASGEVVGAGHFRTGRDTSPKRSAPKTFDFYVGEGRKLGFSEADLWEACPDLMPGAEGAVRMGWPPGWEDAVEFLRTMYDPGDFLFLGEKDTVSELGKNVLRRDEWAAKLERMGKSGATLPTKICPNPVKLEPVEARDHKGAVYQTWRVKESVAAFRWLVLERDVLPPLDDPMLARQLSLAQQLLFWGGWGRHHGWGRIGAVVHTGKKSLHCWMRVDGVATLGQWDEKVRRGLLPCFTAMGFDGTFANPVQLARLPGAARWLEGNEAIAGEERLKAQKLLFLKGARK